MRPEKIHFKSPEELKEEVGLAEPQIINALLQLRGKKGRLAEETQHNLISLYLYAKNL